MMLMGELNEKGQWVSEEGLEKMFSKYVQIRDTGFGQGRMQPETFKITVWSL